MQAMAVGLRSMKVHGGADRKVHRRPILISSDGSE